MRKNGGFSDCEQDLRKWRSSKASAGTLPSNMLPTVSLPANHRDFFNTQAIFHQLTRPTRFASLEDLNRRFSPARTDHRRCHCSRTCHAWIFWPVPARTTAAGFHVNPRLVDSVFHNHNVAQVLMCEATDAAFLHDIVITLVRVPDPLGSEVSVIHHALDATSHAAPSFAPR